MTINIIAYVINLKGKEQNYETTKIKLNDYGFINIQRFDAIVGKDLNYSFQDKIYDPAKNVPVSMEAYLNILNGRILHRQLIGKGTIGCALSHYSLWKWLVDHPEYQQLIIFEDDARPNNNYSIDFLQQIIASVPDFDMLSFGYSDIRGEIEEVNEYVSRFKGGEFFGLQGYMISQSGALKMMKYMFPIEFQVDSYIGYIAKFDPTFKLYMTKESLIDQSYHISSIQKPCVRCYINDLDNVYGWINLFTKKTILILIAIYIIYRMMSKKRNNYS